MKVFLLENIPPKGLVADEQSYDIEYSDWKSIFLIYKECFMPGIVPGGNVYRVLFFEVSIPVTLKPSFDSIRFMLVFFFETPDDQRPHWKRYSCE